MRNINIRDKIWSVYSRIWTKIFRYYHWIKSLYSEFFCSVIFLIRTECEDLHGKPPYSVRMRENTVQKNTNYRHLSQSVCILCVEREGQWITNPQRRSMHRCKVIAQSYGTQKQTSLVILTKLKLELCVVNDTVWFMSMRQEITKKRERARKLPGHLRKKAKILKQNWVDTCQSFPSKKNFKKSKDEE